jgi:hypothetical protein
LTNHLLIGWVDHIKWFRVDRVNPRPINIEFQAIFHNFLPQVLVASMKTDLGRQASVN